MQTQQMLATLEHMKNEFIPRVQDLENMLKDQFEKVRQWSLVSHSTQQFQLEITNSSLQVWNNSGSFDGFRSQFNTNGLTYQAISLS